MEVGVVRIWLILNVEGKEHCVVIDRAFPDPVAKSEITEDTILEIIRQDKKIDASGITDYVSNFKSFDFEDKKTGVSVLEERYMVKLDTGRMSPEGITKALLAFYGIKTKKAKLSEIPWESTMLATVPPLDLGACGFPPKMIAYLSKPANLLKGITGAMDAPNWVELRSPGELCLIDLVFAAKDEHVRITHQNVAADPNRTDKEGRYSGTGIDIIKQNDLYDSEGMLIWIVELRVFGSYDPEHQNLVVFPGADTSAVTKQLGTYLQAQWSYGKDYLVEAGNVYDYYEPWTSFTFSNQ